MHYIVRRGDSMHSIAMNHGTTVRHLMDLNPQIRNPHLIYPGERITVSSGGYQPSHTQWDNTQPSSNQWDNTKSSRNQWDNTQPSSQHYGH